MRRLSVPLAVFCVLSLGMARTPPPVKEKRAMSEANDITDVDARPSEWVGGNCGVSAARAELIRDSQSWEALWKEAFGAQAPSVDFSKHMALAVFAGSVSTGGYGVDFLPPQKNGGDVVLSYRIRPPSASGFVIQAFTQPYAIKLYRAVGSSVRIDGR